MIGADSRLTVLALRAWLDGDEGDRNADRLAAFVIEKAISGHFGNLLLNPLKKRSLMSNENNLDRRCFVGTTVASIVAAKMSFVGATSANAGQPNRLKRIEPIKQIKAGVLDVGLL